LSLKGDSAMSIKLSVNLNAVAFLRNRRDFSWPDPVDLGRIALHAGAAGITVHPRPDERHIRFSDIGDIRAMLDDEFPTSELNIEGYPTKHFMALVENNRADQVTLVPDKPDQSTSDHGWNFEEAADFLQPIVSCLKKNMMRVSLFANPDLRGLGIIQTLGADRVEFYTGSYGRVWNDEDKKLLELKKLEKAAEHAFSLGLAVSAGHDLTIDCLPSLIKRIPYLAEVSIGHGLIADALKYGIGISVQRFLNALVG